MWMGLLAGLAVAVTWPEAAIAPDAIQRDAFGSEWSEADGVVTRTIFSAPLTMEPGQIILHNDIPIEFVQGPAAVVNIASDLVDEQGNSVPLSQAYMHHWLLEGSSERNGIAGFGAGSEYRGLPEGFKKPFALMVAGDEQWQATLHLLDLRLTPPQLHLPSLECRRRVDCTEGPCLQPQVAAMPQTGARGIGDMFDNYPGGLFCCDGGTDGTGASQFDFARRGYSPTGLVALHYRLKLVISYVPLGIPAASMDFGLQPTKGPTSWQHRFVNVYGSRLQVSAPGLEYSVPVCADDDDMCIDVKTNSWTVTNHNTLECTDCPAPAVATDHAEYLSDSLPSARVGIAWAAGHQHDGALGIQLWLRKPGETDGQKTLICHSAPVIGSEDGVAGNERGFVTGQMACRLDEPIEVPVGSVLTIRSIYDAHRPRYSLDGFHSPKNGVEYAHTGVMGYARIRWVDMDAYRSVRASGSAGSTTAASNDLLPKKIAQLLIGLNLSPAQRQQLQDGLQDELQSRQL